MPRHLRIGAMAAMLIFGAVDSVRASSCSGHSLETQTVSINGEAQKQTCDDTTCSAASIADFSKLRFDVKTAGRYLLWLRTRGAKDDARTVEIVAQDGAASKMAVSTGAEWHWDAATAGDGAKIWDLESGPFEVKLQLPKLGLELDCALLTREKTVVPSAVRVIDIDQVWAGVATSVGALKHGNHVYVAYYDVDRWLTVADVNLDNGKILRKRVPSQFDGWDAHNSTELSADSEGYLHVSGNMHVSPLIYARSDKPWSLSGLDSLRPMTSRDESRATYPDFTPLSHGRLLFSHRIGMAGSGDFFLDVYQKGHWRTLLDGPFTVSTWKGKSISAYPTSFAIGEGVVAAAIVWRGSVNVETNTRLSFVQSQNLEHWKTAAGQPVMLPLNPDGVDIVDDVRPGGGLLNNHKICLDASHRPIIAYTKYDAQGFNQIYIAYFNGQSWKKKPITKWQRRWEVLGGGTLPGNVEFSQPILNADGAIQIETHHWEAGSDGLIVSPQTLDVIGHFSPEQSLSNLDRIPSREFGPGSVRIERIADVTRTPTSFYLLWHAFRSLRDQPRNCAGCPTLAHSDFSSTLQLIEAR